MASKKWINEATFFGHTDSVRCVLVWKWNEKKRKRENGDNAISLSLSLDHSIYTNDDDDSLSQKEKKINILFSGSADNSIRIWNLSNGECLNIWNNTHNHTVRCLKQWNKWLISGSYDFTIRVWKIDKKTLNINQSTQTQQQQQGNCISILTQHTSFIFGLEIWNNSLVSVSGDKSICIWKYQQQLSSNNFNFICSQQIVCETQIYCVKLWNDCIVTGHGFGDGNEGSDNSIRIWRKKSNGNTIHLSNQFIGHTDRVHCLEVWIENNNQLISGSWDETIRLWNSNGECLSIFKGHANGISSIIVWNDILFSGSTDNAIKVWNSNGNCLATLMGHTDAVNCLTIHKDKLINGSSDKSIKLWTQKYNSLDKRRAYKRKK